MSKIKFKDQIIKFDNPKNMFSDYSLNNNLKYVIKSSDGNTIIFTKTKKFLKQRKDYVKKLLMSDKEFQLSEKNKDMLDNTISRDIKKLSDDNDRLMKLCTDLYNNSFESKTVKVETNTVDSIISTNIPHNYINISNVFNVSDFSHGTYFIQSDGTKDIYNNMQNMYIFKTSTNKQPSIYNIKCYGVFTVKTINENELEILYYDDKYLGENYLSIIQNIWGFQKSYTFTLNNTPSYLLNKSTIITRMENMTVHDIDHPENLSINLLNISNKLYIDKYIVEKFYTESKEREEN